MNWARWLLRQKEKLCILVLVLLIAIFWLKAPEDELNEEDDYVSETSE